MLAISSTEGFWGAHFNDFNDFNDILDAEELKPLSDPFHDDWFMNKVKFYQIPKFAGNI